MTALLAIGLAAWIIWETFLTLIPLRIPGQVQPFLVAALCYGMIRWIDPFWLHVLDSVAVVALLHAYVQADQPTPSSLPRAHRRRQPGPAVGKRLPDLPS